MYHLLNKRDASSSRIFSNESCSEQWRTAQNSVLALGRSNAESICSAISNGNEVNNKLHTRFSSAVAAGVEDNDVSSKSLLILLMNVKSTVTSSKVELHELQRGHQRRQKESQGMPTDLWEMIIRWMNRLVQHREGVNSTFRASQSGTDLVKSFWDSRTPTILAKGNGKHTLENQRAPWPLLTRT
ncbi:hypothetical protein EJB05_50974, partial [Eragrostis curvula]